MYENVALAECRRLGWWYIGIISNTPKRQEIDTQRVVTWVWLVSIRHRSCVYALSSGPSKVPSASMESGLVRAQQARTLGLRLEANMLRAFVALGVLPQKSFLSTSDP